jgi:hypothetical protein
MAFGYRFHGHGNPSFTTALSQLPGPTASWLPPWRPPAVQPRARTMDLLIAATTHAHPARLYAQRQ